MIQGIPDHAKLEAICQRYHIRKLSLFGSALRGELRPDSDVDLLVEFDSNHVPGLIGLVRIQRELTSLFGRRVDLRTAGDLSRYFRESIVREATALYEAA
jgi:uncharacterized protein